MAEHGRVYPDSTEKRRRFVIFKENLEFVEKFNNDGEKTYKLSVNEFSDMTNEEFLSHHTGYKTPTGSSLTRSPKQMPGLYFPRPHIDYPDSVDWREQGAVTDIKNQIPCNACWAFAAMAAVEGITFIKTGQLVSLSEQQLLDCDKSSNGCQEGDMEAAYTYIIENGGTATEEEYPYLNTSVRQKCDTQKEKKHATHISDFVFVPESNQRALHKAVSMQPVSVAISANGTEFKSYKRGVFSGPCDGPLNHAVTIIGYGTENGTGTNYWLIKNSWGETWGEKGYMRILRSTTSSMDDGLCGLAIQAYYPIV
ncbi:putative fruit bromelain [Rosa chinensis]|uniref:Putative fruit bromelain n=1 Tax=Rosa chinensis TaxID=74649 RepID=A0A2P6Q862_ROSCH|nr:ervatamin-B [Rosa chinensis]PRQ30354.1 putative fruit bromelain [Rosa chinensis]